jgi:hypothetical protein
MPHFFPKLLASAALCMAASSCSLITVDSQDGPPGARAEGLVDGHAVFGWRAEDTLLRAELLDGTSDGALFELTVWKLLRVEVGLVGLCVGLGPIDLGLGTLFFDPTVPPLMGEESEGEDEDEDEDDDDDDDDNDG